MADVMPNKAALEDEVVEIIRFLQSRPDVLISLKKLMGSPASPGSTNPPASPEPTNPPASPETLTPASPVTPASPPLPDGQASSGLKRPLQSPDGTPSSSAAPSRGCTDDSSTEDDEGYTTVVKRSGKKMRQNASSSPTPMEAETSQAPQATTSAPTQPPASPAPLPTQASAKKPPKLYLQLPKDLTVTALFCQLNGIAIKISHNEWNRAQQMLMLHPATINDHRALTRFLDARQFFYYTHALPDERRYRYVIRGIPLQMSPEEVKTGLLEKGINALEVHRMHRSHRSSPHANTAFEMVLAILKSPEDAKRIFELRDISGLRGFRIESPHKKGFVGQCRNCIRYGHSSRGCRLPPRCVKCTGDHSTAECPRPKDRSLCTEPPSCTLCKQSGHTGNYRGCPKAPKAKLPRAPQAPAPQPTFRLAPAPTRNPWVKEAPKPQAQSGVTPAPAAPSPPSPSATTAPPVVVAKAKPIPVPQVTLAAAPTPAPKATTNRFSEGIWAKVRALSNPETSKLHHRLAECIHLLEVYGENLTLVDEVVEIQGRLQQNVLNVVFGSQTQSP